MFTGFVGGPVRREMWNAFRNRRTSISTASIRSADRPVSSQQLASFRLHKKLCGLAVLSTGFVWSCVRSDEDGGLYPYSVLGWLTHRYIFALDPKFPKEFRDQYNLYPNLIKGLHESMAQLFWAIGFGDLKRPSTAD